MLPRRGADAPIPWAHGRESAIKARPFPQIVPQQALARPLHDHHGAARGFHPIQPMGFPVAHRDAGFIRQTGCTSATAISSPGRLPAASLNICVTWSSATTSPAVVTMLNPA